jgi:Flp pilus assembly protein TadD
MRQGHLELAVSAFTAALELDPGIAEAYGNRGLALMALGKDAEAQADLKKAMELKPDLKKELERRTGLAKELTRVSAARNR